MNILQIKYLSRQFRFLVWILGLIVIFLIKLIHLLIFAIIGDRCLLINSVHNSKNDSHENPIIRIRSSSLKYRLWLGLCLNSFTCGVMLGTTIYHLIPHVRKVFYHQLFDFVLFRSTQFRMKISITSIFYVLRLFSLVFIYSSLLRSSCDFDLKSMK